jgi:RNA polymerase sigma-70 factor, ECF subfamily
MRADVNFPEESLSVGFMRPVTASGSAAIPVEDPALEFDDFDRLVHQYRPRVLRFLFASLRDMDLAESLTQDCFWNAYKSRTTFRGDCNVNTWLMRISVNLVRNHLRSRRFQFWKKIQNTGNGEMHDWPDRSISPEERASIQQRVQSVWDATAALSQRQRTVFLLRFLEEMDISEIAQTTGITENSVKVHLFRAVRGIRKQLGASQ